MKDILSDLNKAFESRVRLGIMSILMVNDYADFNTLKEMLEVSDGNLASHISALEKLEYLSVEKKFVGKKTNTTYATTDEGRKAFKDHLDALERLIRGS
jgi:DNA-binding MarR family transcriptional regulator